MLGFAVMECVLCNCLVIIGCCFRDKKERHHEEENCHEEYSQVEELKPALIRAESKETSSSLSDEEEQIFRVKNGLVPGMAYGVPG